MGDMADLQRKLPYEEIDANTKDEKRCHHKFAEGVYGGPCLRCGKTPVQIQLDYAKEIKNF